MNYIYHVTQLYRRNYLDPKGKKHLGAAIGSEIYREEYINEKIDTWIREIKLLSEIAAFAPQEAYTCFTSGYKHKLNFCMRTIPSIFFFCYLFKVDKFTKSLYK